MSIKSFNDRTTQLLNNKTVKLIAKIRISSTKSAFFPTTISQKYKKKIHKYNLNYRCYKLPILTPNSGYL